MKTGELNKQPLLALFCTIKETFETGARACSAVHARHEVPHLLRLGLAVRQQTIVGCSKGENTALSQICIAPADLSLCPDQVKLAERSAPTASSAREAQGRNSGHGHFWPEKYLHRQR